VSPLEIQNPSLYHDRTTQDWHRRTLPKRHTAIDIDLFGYCDFCYDPLYVIESTTNPTKPVGVIFRMSRRLQVPAFRVLHNTEHVVWAQQVQPRSIVRHNPQDFAALLHQIRRVHYEDLPDHHHRITELM
jgi:hypothetical protein